MSLLGALGLRPDGDPEGMRLYAASLRASAELVEAAGEGAAASVEAATFHGPAGEATKYRAGRLRGRTAARAGELRSLADAVTREAGELEQSQNVWERLRDRLVAEAGKLADGP